MDFALADEHRLIQRTVNEWGQRAIAPRIQELDQKAHFDRDILKEMASLGLLGLCIDETWGGAGMDYIALGLACEELEFFDTSLRVILSVHLGLNSMTLATWGTAEQKQRYLVPQAQGQLIATYALTEPDAGSDAVAIRTSARKEGNDYLISGEKMWISLADVADVFLTFAWTDPEKRQRRDHTGITAFLVERKMKGVRTSTIHGKFAACTGPTRSSVPPIG